MWPAKNCVVSDFLLVLSIGWVTELRQRAKAGRIPDAVVSRKRGRVESKGTPC